MNAAVDAGLSTEIDERTRQILHRRRTTSWAKRGWLVRRMLCLADLVGLSFSYLIAHLLFGDVGETTMRFWIVFAVFVATLPVWVVLSKLYGLYDRDEEVADQSTVNEIVAVFHLVTVGAWLFFAMAWLSDLSDPDLAEAATFWALAITLVTAGRALARAFSRKRLAYLQNTIIVGAGDVGQLVARKFLQHPEYGINLVGFVDAAPKDFREDIARFPLLGSPEQLPEIIRTLEVERVVVAFSNDSSEEMLELLRSLRDVSVQVDIVPRLFEILGPNLCVHTVEGLPLVGLPPVKLSRSSQLIKRTMDVAGALLGLVFTAPLVVYIAWRIKRDSPGPILFRQTRLGMNMQEFTVLKFRTMRADADEETHRRYVGTIMSSRAVPGESGIYKLDREDDITPVGRWLRKTSLDELPQLWNVLRGDMSLVGPRPCMGYETEHFAPHHFERFLMPAGLTGLWQVTARNHSTFGEAIDMDVAYVRGWSLALDLSLLLRTPMQLLRHRGTA